MLDGGYDRFRFYDGTEEHYGSLSLLGNSIKDFVLEYPIKMDFYHNITHDTGDMDYLQEVIQLSREHALYTLFDDKEYDPLLKAPNKHIYHGIIYDPERYNGIVPINSFDLVIPNRDRNIYIFSILHSQVGNLSSGDLKGYKYPYAINNAGMNRFHKVNYNESQNYQLRNINDAIILLDDSLERKNILFKESLKIFKINVFGKGINE